MIRRLHYALFAALISLGCAPLPGVTLGTVSGSVRDSGGVPQIGVVVQLLQPDLTVVASVYTDDLGRFVFPSVVPGKYCIKAMGTAFLPSLRENLRVRTHSVVNLTLNTLFEVMQWLPAEPRAANAQKDDWAWTLRSSANRPLLRWLEDGPLMVVTDRPGGAPKLKARLMATGQAGTFGENGERFSAAVEDTPDSSRALLARVDFAPNTDAGMESMLGFRQDLGFAGSVQSVAAVAIHPEIESADTEGLDEVALRSSESIHLGDALDAEAGSSQVMARFSADSPNTIAAVLPFASVRWHEGESTFHYSVSTMATGQGGEDDTESVSWLPRVSDRDGRLAIEHGIHQEMGWERHTLNAGMAVLVYADSIENPVVEAAARLAQAGAPEGALYDLSSGLLRSAGPDYSTAGFEASVERRLPTGDFIRVSYANGDALVMPAAPRSTAISQLMGAAHPRRAQMYSLALSGTLEGTKTQWRASYRWQSADTVTQVAPFTADAGDPYLNLHVRQPLCSHGDGKGRIDALLDVRNLLAEGYHPYVMGDGSLLVFAQDQRSIRGGVAFTF